MITIIFLVFLGLLLFLAVRFLYKSWWYPLYLQHLLISQGIRGSPFKFASKKTREIEDVMEMELSHDIFPRLQPHTHSWIKLYGRTYFTWSGETLQLVATDLEMIREILNNKEGAFAKHTFNSGPLVKLFGNGLLFSEGQHWSKLRRLADLAFHAQNLKDMVPAMIGSVEAMLRTWKSFEGKEMEVFEQLKLLSSEVISKTAFGGGYLEGKQIFQQLDKLSRVVFMSFRNPKMHVLGKLFRTSEDIESDKLHEALRDSFMAMIKKREDSVKAGQSDSYGSDFLGSLLRAHHDADENTRISMDDIIDECKTFYFAGHESTANVLSWTLLLLAIHTDWQEKARREVVELFGQENPETDKLSRLKIIGMVINESLRLYPTVTKMWKRVARKTRLGKLTIPAGINVMIPALAVHHSREIWGEDAHLFNPERFAQGLAEATRNQLMAFLGFSFGLRKCVGMSFVTMEMKIALSMILQRYKFTLSPNYRHSPAVILNLRPKRGVQIMLHPL